MISSPHDATIHLEKYTVYYIDAESFYEFPAGHLITKFP